MIGKKINELATELAPVSTDLTIIGDPLSGVSKKITIAQLGAIFSGAVSFYTNLASFPALGDINVIYCAKDTKKLYLWDGSAYVEVFPAQALLDTYQLRSEKGVSNGYASLDSGGKVPISQLPSSIMEYKGTWNAATNTPTLANGTGDTGDVYICNVAGSVDFGAGPITFAVGDYVIYSGSIWQRSSGAVGTVTSVAVSRSGDALAITGSPITTSGTINIGFAGTGAQYIKGDGTLATFPSIISQAQNLVTEVYNSTGATLTKGTIVYINGGQGNLPTVTKALATGDSTSAQTYGIVQNDITNNNNGYVVVAGRLSDIDTQAFVEGTQLYLSSTTAGTYTSTKQYAPAHLVYVGIIVRSHPTQGIIEVKIQNGYELDELHNVAAQTPTNNDGLFWEASTSLWKNKSIATILGYTPQPQLNGTGFVKASGTTITYDNSTYLTTSAAATTYLPMVLSSTANVVDINGQQFSIYDSAGGYTSGRIIVDPVFSAIGYQNAGVFDGLKILTNGNAEFSNSGVTRFFNQVRFDSTLTNGTYTYTLPGATGTLALTSDLTGGTVTSVGLSSATSGVTIGSTPVTTSGTITLAIATASGSQQGLLSSTDWTTFNNKQSALTNPVTGTGTTNYLPKFTGTSTIGNSQVYDNGTSVGIGTATPNTPLSILGSHVSGQSILKVQSSTAYSASGLSSIGFNDADGTRKAIVYTNSDGLQLETGTATPILFNPNGNEKMRLNASGNLSIGNTNDTYKLDVSGTGRFTGQLNNTQAGHSTIGLYLSSYQPSGINWYDNDDFEQYSMGIIANSGNGYWGLWSSTSSTAIDRSVATPIFKVGRTGAATFSSSVTAQTNLGFINTNASQAGFVADYTGTGAVKVSMSTYNDIFQVYNETNGYSIFNFKPSTKAFVINPTGGNVGIGTTSPSALLHLSSGTPYIYLDDTSTSGTRNRFQMVMGDVGVVQTMNFGFNNTSGSSLLDVLTINENGRVGIGTTSPGSTYSELLQVSKADVGRINVTHTNNASSRQSDILFTEGATLQLQVGTILGNGGYDDQNWIRGVANIPLVFHTNSTERMRITSGGEVYIAGTTDQGAYNLQVNGTGVWGAGAYVNGSDFRLKENILELDNSLELINKMKPVTYNYKGSYSKDNSTQTGFIAQDLKELLKDKKYLDGIIKQGPEYMSVAYQNLIPLLVKGIQEQQSQINELKSQLNK